jgi:poly(3-hydroxybutyrate) depolymerase
MVYPNGVDGAWAGPKYAKTSVAEDLQFVSDLLADLRSNYCIDDSRIYATG